MIDYLGLAAVLVLELLVFTALSDTFGSSSTFYSITRKVPHTVIVAVGMTFVLMVAGIDLSVGSVLAFSQAVLGFCIMKLQGSVPVSLLVVIAVASSLVTGLFCGVVNGLVVIRWSLPSFIVTLGMLEVARGGTYLMTNSRAIYIGDVVEGLSRPVPGLGDISWPFVLCIILVIAGQVVLSYTVFGRYVRAVGSNREAVRLSGINPGPVVFKVFVLCGLLSGLAGLIQASKMSTASPTAGEGFELNVIAACVIGGTSLMGGYGSVVKSFLGVLIVEVLDSGLVDLGASDAAKRLIIGVVIVLAVILDYYRRKLTR